MLHTILIAQPIFASQEERVPVEVRLPQANLCIEKGYYSQRCEVPRVKFLFDPDARFECSGCAKCCKTPWKVEIDRVTLDRYKGSILELHIKRETGRPALARTHDGRIVAAKNNNSCVFLGEANNCRLHSNLGEHIKPATCRMFPFILTPTPEGIVVGVSHYCNSVQDGQGRPLESYQEELEAQLEELSLPEAEVPIRVGNGRALDWATYLEFEKELLAAISSNSPEKALVGAFEGLSDWAEDPASERPALVGRKPRVDLSLVERLAQEFTGHPGLDSTQLETPDWLMEGSSAYVRHVILRKQLVAQPPMLELLAKLLVVPAVLLLSAGSPPTVEGFRAGLDKLEMALVHQQVDGFFGATHGVAAQVSFPTLPQQAGSGDDNI